jgi:hypothetical protein
MRSTQIRNEIDGGIHEEKEKETVIVYNFSRNHSFARHRSIGRSSLCMNSPLLAPTGVRTCPRISPPNQN